MANKPVELRTCVFYDPESAKADEGYGCMGQFAPGRSDSPYCPRCRSNASYWASADKKRPGSMRRYRNKLACRHARLDEWAGISAKYEYQSPRKEKVVHINTVRKAKYG